MKNNICVNDVLSVFTQNNVLSKLLDVPEFSSNKENHIEDYWNQKTYYKEKYSEIILDVLENNYSISKNLEFDIIFKKAIDELPIALPFKKLNQMGDDTKAVLLKNKIEYEFIPKLLIHL